MAAWDWPQTVAASQELLDDRRRVSEGRPDSTLTAAQQDDTPWVPSALLRDGAVLSRLMTGDVSGARRAFDFLQPAGDTDFRGRILEGYLQAAERTP